MSNRKFFTNPLWTESQPVYEQILKHPFITELSEGTLSLEQFGFYLQQDALYLIDFSRALSCIASRSSDVNNIINFSKYATCAGACERELHKEYFKYYQIDPTEEKNEACFTYTHYLLSVAALEPIEVAVAAALPCFWVYRDVGLHIYNNAFANNPFEKWINTYSSEEFSSLVDEAIGIAEKMYDCATPAIKLAMQKAAYRSTYLEWKFWENAYKFKEDFSFPMAFELQLAYNPKF